MRTKQKILQLSKGRLKVVGFTIFFNVLLAGSVCGTFAWYTYATRTGFEEPYHGVTVGDTGTLQTGLVSLVELNDYASFDLVEDKETLSDENKIIYWCKQTIDPRTLNYVIEHNGSATSSIIPVTTGSDDLLDESDFHLYKAPRLLQDYSLDENGYADKDNYVFIPFVFRYEDVESDNLYAPDKEVYFTVCDTHASASSPEKEIYRAIRIFAQNSTNSYVINPTAEEDSHTDVGGILDLNNDGFYDYDANGYEHIYGESQSYNYNSEVTQADGTIPVEERTTFVSNHKKDKYALNEETYVPKIISYKCMNDFANKSKAIAVTDANYHYLAVLDFYVYAEGWDLHVIDEEKGSGFNMNIKFEVNP